MVLKRQTRRKYVKTDFDSKELNQSLHKTAIDLAFMLLYLPPIARVRMKWMTYYLTLIFVLLSFFPITCSQTNNFFTLKTYRAGPCSLLCCDSLTESSKIHVMYM